jgi:hypothetical protein
LDRTGWFFRELWCSGREDLEMIGPEECLAKAADAEKLAELVSFGADKERLRRSAAEWRARAALPAGAGASASLAARTLDSRRDR